MQRIRYSKAILRSFVLEEVMKFARALGAVLVVAASVASIAHAAQTPAQRTCRIAGGYPWVLFLDRDDLELCRFGNGAIGSLSFYYSTVLDQTLEAVTVFNEHPAFQGCGSGCDDEAEYCEQVGGNIVVADDSNHATFRVCQFHDESAIELATLFRGPNDPSNRALVRALSGRNN